MVITDEQLQTLLLNKLLINQEKLAEVKEYAKNSDMTLSDALVEKNVLPDEFLGRIVAEYLRVPFVDLSKLSIPDEILKIIPERIARRKKIIPFAKNEQGLHVAMSDPTNTSLLEMVVKKTETKVFPYYATVRDINNSIHIYKKDLQKVFDKLLGQSIESKAADDAPVEKLVDTLIDYAYQDRASDIHIEPREKESLVRFRIDGILHDVLYIPKNLHDRIVTRIKILSRLRTDEHLTAQDGKMRIKLEEENLDIRVSILPIVDGEKIVMRLLSSKSRQFSLVDLGMSEEDLGKVTKGFSKSYGMILATGPTGSGKSTSIYSILKILNTREKNITTIEDPVEYRIKGVNQIQVNQKTNLTFAMGLRSILRQDPNVVFVGEIRDNETAGIAVNAALTGHLVLSTLHTNDAATTLPRLTDMQVEPFLVASTVNIIMAQRLIRKICDSCRISFTMPYQELVQHLSPEIVQKHYTPDENNQIRLYKGQGCKLCRDTGYRGRIGLFEVLVVSEAVRTLITDKKGSDEIYRAAVADGMNTMLDDGLEKVAKGLTTIEEVLRVTKIES